MSKKKVESLVLPMELLRHLKPSDFSDANEYRAWQLRQLNVLEAGLVSHPSVPLADRGNNNPAAATLREAIRSTATTATLDVRALSAAVMALSWRSVDVCRWADGYPLNLHLYLSLLRAVFDGRDVLDELLELIKKTWGVLGLNRTIHDVCFTWLLFEKHVVVTGQQVQVDEPSDLLSAALAMLQQLRGQLPLPLHDNDDLLPEPAFLIRRVLAATLTSMHSWAEEKLLDYHEAFQSSSSSSFSSMEKVVSLAVSAAEMLRQYCSAADDFFIIIFFILVTTRCCW
ncbi:hypothetical protein PR202_gb13787 [Eleusine coracana subsp. coracana]|uniref:Uncharacterized protein n=1 Tax=Eleusine coracana subsp. coracana TaxID=191504 RepID=A0AAV5ETI8_ELECO|nr:hypothetical protein PR202_gb13787 [Eleusine coracana subsp. coracana]